MALRTEDLLERVTTLSKDVDDTFLDLGRTLRQLQNREPQLFSDVVAKAGLGVRKAYYLVDVSRAFDPLKVSPAKLKAVGWTKLATIAKRVTQENVEELLGLAEQYNVKELERMARGDHPLGNSRCVMMYFSPIEYEELEEALIRHGARTSRGGRGLADKEKALMTIVRKAMGKKVQEQVS